MANPLIPPNGVYDISANKLNIFLGCKYKLYLYLSHQPNGDVDTTYIDAGNAVHNYMEDHLNGCGLDISDYIEKYNVKDSMYDRVNTCVETGQQYLSLKGEPERTEFTEFTTPKGRKIKLQSRIDFLAENAKFDGLKEKVIIDWKTGKSVDKDEYRLQGHVYKFVHPDHDVAFVSLLSGDVMTLKKSPKNYIPNMCDKYVDCIESSDFKRNVTPLCSRFCPYYKDYCAPGTEYNIVKPRMVWDDEKKEWSTGDEDEEQ